MADEAGAQALFDLWKKQMDEAARVWAQRIGQTPAPDPAAFWQPLVDSGLAAWSKLPAHGPVAPDVLGQWKQLLDQSIAAWGKALEQAMGTEAFAQALGKYLDQWLSQQERSTKVMTQISEATLSALGLPSRSQVTAIARQQKDLEDRIDRLDDRLDALMTQVNDRFAALAKREKGSARRAATKEPQ